MKNTIKFAVVGVAALAASSTAALAGSQLPAGATTGLALGAPLPEGVYDISIASYGSRGGSAPAPSAAPATLNPLALSNLAYAVPVWVIWSTPWQVAGGRIMLDSMTPVASAWNPGDRGLLNGSADSFLNTLLDGGIAWNLHNGWNFGLHAGVYLASDQAVAQTLGRDYAAFQGIAAISYIKNGWNLSATGIYGTGGNPEKNPFPQSIIANIQTQQGDWFNLDLTATRKFGKLETGFIAYGSWDLSNSTHGLLTGAPDCVKNYLSGGIGACKQSQFALGSLVGYDFGSFVAQAKIAADVAQENYNGREVRGTLTIIKPLWNPEAGSLK